MKRLILIVLILSGLAFAQRTPTTLEDTQTITGNKTFTGAVSISGATSITAGAVNSVLNPGSCGGTNPPSWCSGDDIGAWIDAAIAAGASAIQIPSGRYNFSTTIKQPRTVAIYGSGAYQTILNFTPTSGWAWIAADAGGGVVAAAHGLIQDLTLKGPGSTFTNPTGGVYLGGSDGLTGGRGTVTVGACTSTCTVTYASGINFNPNWAVWQPITINGASCLINNVSSGTSLTVDARCSATPTSGAYTVMGSPSTGTDPSGNYGDNIVFNRVRILNFNTAVQWGNHAWLNSFIQSNLSANAVGMYFPADLTESGEAISINAGTLIGSNGQGIVTAKNGNPDVDFHISQASVDYNVGWALANGSVHSQFDISGSHVEQPQLWLTSIGPLSVSNSVFTNGSRSGTVGYLIDAENSSTACSFTNTTAFNSGTGVVFNPSGQTCSLFNVYNTGTGIGNPANYNGINPVYYQTQAMPGNTFTAFGSTIPGMRGATLAWNVSGGTGEGDIVVNKGGGSGGLNVYTCSAPCSSRTLIGGLQSNGGFFSTGPSPFFAQGTTAMPTEALAANTCSSAVTVATTGVTTSMRVVWNLHSSPSGVSGYGSSPVTIFAWLSSGNVNFMQCATTAVTPGSMSVDWTVF